MTSYTRNVSGVTSGAAPAPAWRQAMTASNTLYRLTTRSNLDDLLPKIVWPGGARPSKYGTGDWDSVTMHYGFGGAVHAEDLGPFGTMVYGGTGEDTFAQQLSSLSLHEDNPEWQMLQQPFFALSDAEAAAADADWYYNPAAANALPSTRKMDDSYVLPADWDKQFPVAIGTQGWVLRRKAKMTMGRNQPHVFRYNMPCWIPASMTGTGAGAVLVNTDAFAGPYRGNNGKPANVGPNETFKPADYCAEVWPDGGQKLFVHAMNTVTKAWTRLESAPFAAPVGGEITRSHSFVDRAAKRVYYKSGEFIYYFDFTAGLAGVAARQPVRCTVVPDTTILKGDVFDVDSDAGAGMTEGHPTGRRLMYLKNNGTRGSELGNALHLVDLDNAKIYMLALQSRGMQCHPHGDVGFGYDPATNRMHLTWRDKVANVIKCSTFEIPSDPTRAANYNITTNTLALASGVALEDNMNFQCRFADHGKFHTALGVIVFQQRNHPPLVFRPA